MRMMDALQKQTAAPGLTLTSEIFVDEQPPYYSFAEPTIRKTGAQVLAEIEQDG